MMELPKYWEQVRVGNGIIMSKYYTRHNKLEYWSNPHESPVPPTGTGIHIVKGNTNKQEGSTSKCIRRVDSPVARIS